MVLLLLLSNFACLNLGLDEAACLVKNERNTSTAQSSRTLLIWCQHFSYFTWMKIMISNSSGCKEVELKFAADPGSQ